jgi:hypothetical protein
LRALRRVKPVAGEHESLLLLQRLRPRFSPSLGDESPCGYGCGLSLKAAKRPVRLQFTPSAPAPR